MAGVFRTDFEEASVVYIRLEDPGRGHQPRTRRMNVDWARGKLKRLSERLGSINFLIRGSALAMVGWHVLVFVSLIYPHIG